MERNQHPSMSWWLKLYTVWHDQKSWLLLSVYMEYALAVNTVRRIEVDIAEQVIATVGSATSQSFWSNKFTERGIIQLWL